MTTPRGGARPGAGRPRRTGPRSKPIWCGQMSEEDRKLILETLEPKERHAALMDAVMIKEAKGATGMNPQVLAQDLINSQGVATIEDYGGSVRRYREALVELADENGWTKGIDRAELRQWLTYYLHGED